MRFLPEDAEQEKLAVKSSTQLEEEHSDFPGSGLLKNRSKSLESVNEALIQV